MVGNSQRQLRWIETCPILLLRLKLEDGRGDGLALHTHGLQSSAQGLYQRQGLSRGG